MCQFAEAIFVKSNFKFDLLGVEHYLSNVTHFRKTEIKKGITNTTDLDGNYTGQLEVL